MVINDLKRERPPPSLGGRGLRVDGMRQFEKGTWSYRKESRWNRSPRYRRHIIVSTGVCLVMADPSEIISRKGYVKKQTPVFMTDPSVYGKTQSNISFWFID